MEVIAELSGSQLLVTASLGLFATIIFSSVYLRLRNQYRLRSRLGQDTRRKDVVRFDASDKPGALVEQPVMNEVVSRARPKEQTRGDVFTTEPYFGSPDDYQTSTLEEIDHDSYEEGDHELAEYSDTNDAKVDNGYAVEMENDESDWQSQVSDTEESETYIDASDETGDEQLTDIGNVEWQETESSDTGSSKELKHIPISEWGLEAKPPEAGELGIVEAIETNGIQDENELTIEEIEDDTEQQKGTPQVEADTSELEVEMSEYDDESENASDPTIEVREPTVVPLDTRVSEVQRADDHGHALRRNLVVVSVCLISQANGRVYRDIRGEQLGQFLTSRKFIPLDAEYHLQRGATIDSSGIRIRNFEVEPIVDLVKNDGETRGFRLYFRPSESDDPVASLNEMLRIAHSAVCYFESVCDKPLIICDGRKPNQPLTQEMYRELCDQLIADSDRNGIATGQLRTRLSPNGFEPSTELVSQAELS